MNKIITEFFPRLYHNLVRPKWFTDLYIHQNLKLAFDFNDKTVLDFGSGTGANCSLFSPGNYMGLEPDQKRVIFSKKSYPDYHFHVLKEQTLPLEDQSIDYILIVSVLHHISSEELIKYAKEFKRVLRQGGKIVAIEPYLCKSNPICNWLMKWLDQGKFIREENGYLNIFYENGYECNVLKRFRKCFVYNELFFSAGLKSK
ncbi:hypothetical protein GCM10008967_18260 [Bacillus carboniphilus]|uniref:Methyltransferase type 11 domain-containing protein n=1 Tax=Bacillus carboniphilus TaxID=86663 RepID=A0ABP3FYY4_9BACI